MLATPTWTTVKTYLRPELQQGITGAMALAVRLLRDGATEAETAASVERYLVDLAYDQGLRCSLRARDFDGLELAGRYAVGRARRYIANQPTTPTPETP